MRRTLILMGIALLAGCGGNAVAPTSTPPKATLPAALPSPTGAAPSNAISVTAIVTVVVTPAPTNTIAPTVAPAPTSTPTPATVKFTAVNGGRPGVVASVTIQGPPLASCTIAYTTPAGTVSSAQGLVAKTTDGGGTASWSWVIGTATRPGTGTVAVRCGSASASTPITIG